MYPVTSHLTTLNKLGHHDDHLDLLLPYHSPKVAESVWQGCLRSDVRTRSVETVDEVGIDVLVLVVITSGQGLDLHS